MCRMLHFQPNIFSHILDNIHSSWMRSVNVCEAKFLASIYLCVTRSNATIIIQLQINSQIKYTQMQFYWDLNRVWIWHEFTSTCLLPVWTMVTLRCGVLAVSVIILENRPYHCDNKTKPMTLMTFDITWANKRHRTHMNTFKTHTTSTLVWFWNEIEGERAQMMAITSITKR